MAKNLNLRIAAQHKAVRAKSAARRAARWMIPIEIELSTRKYIYADGSPVDGDDPRVKRGLDPFRAIHSPPRKPAIGWLG